VQTLKQLIWSILAILPFGAFADEVYVSVGEDGQIVYSDRPTGSDQEEIIQIRSGGQASAAQPAAAAAGTSAAQPARPTAGESLVAELPRASTPEELAADRARNCEVARQKNDTYSTAHRLYRELADGEREYLTADELTAAKTHAEADVAAWCD
jgi:hypothetical protein